MTIGQTIRLLLSPQKRLLNQFTATAADAEKLAENLRRHSELCSAPGLKAAVEKLAAAAATEARNMRELLLENGAWPKLPDRPVHVGSSNWDRLRSDLELQVEILRALHLQHPQWTSIDSKVAERIRQFASEQELNLSVLRDLTLKCDPQALD